MKVQLQRLRYAAVCKSFDDFTHQVHVRHDAVQIDVLVQTVSPAAANPHGIDGGNAQ